jgi:class 3 adenylate cyclase
MPIYIDRHFVEGATDHAVSNAHEKDLKIQDKYGIKFLTYWFDETRSTAFCLVDAPDKDAIQKAHNEAHGLVPHEIIEVDPSIVESFLGRIKDPEPVEPAGEIQIDAAFRAIMFTDLLDSTQMTTTHGDSKALHMLHINNVITRNALREFKGNEVKHTGDGIMASFISVTDAVECAIAIQKAFDEHNQSNPDAPLYLRIGLSAGEPIEEHGDLFGRAVQLAARLCAHAEPGQILVAQVVKDTCKGKALPFSDMGELSLKGFDQVEPVYKIELQEV